MEATTTDDEDAPWYERFYGDAYLNVYANLLTPERSEREVSFVEKAPALQPGEQVLDLCCGTGRHAIPLLQRGYAVTGQDLSLQYVEAAKAAAADAGLKLEIVHGDMRVIPFFDRFDAVINMFSSFGYLGSEAEDLKVLGAVCRALKQGGRFFIDLLNREWAIMNFWKNDNDWFTGKDGTVYLQERNLDLVTSTNHNTFVALSPDGSRRELDGYHIRLYTLTEMVGFLSATGLTFDTVYGGFDGVPYTAATPRMIIVATKPAA